MKGPPITTVQQIIDLSSEKRSVIYRGTNPKPAAFFMQWRVAMLENEIKQQAFNYYNKDK